MSPPDPTPYKPSLLPPSQPSPQTPDTNTPLKPPQNPLPTARSTSPATQNASLPGKRNPPLSPHSHKHKHSPPHPNQTETSHSTNATHSPASKNKSTPAQTSALGTLQSPAVPTFGETHSHSPVVSFKLAGAAQATHPLPSSEGETSPSTHSHINPPSKFVQVETVSSPQTPASADALIHIHKSHPHANLLPEPCNRRANRPCRPRTTPAPNRNHPTRIRLCRKPNRPLMQNRIPPSQNPSLLPFRPQSPSTPRRKIYRRPRQARKNRRWRANPCNRIRRHRHPAILSFRVQPRIHKTDIAISQPSRRPPRYIIARRRNRPPYHRRPGRRPCVGRQRCPIRQPRRKRPIRRRIFPAHCETSRKNRPQRHVPVRRKPATQRPRLSPRLSATPTAASLHSPVHSKT